MNASADDALAQAGREHKPRAAGSVAVVNASGFSNMSTAVGAKTTRFKRSRVLPASQGMGAALLTGASATTIGPVPGAGNAKQQQADVRILDGSGQDVTPLPLMQPPKQPKNQPIMNQQQTSLKRVSIMAAEGGNSGSMASTVSGKPMISVMDYFTTVEGQTLSHFSSLNFGKSFANFNQSRMISGGMSMAAGGDDETASAASDRSGDESDFHTSSFKRGGTSKGGPAHLSIPSAPTTTAPGKTSPVRQQTDTLPSLSTHLANEMPSATRDLSEAELNRMLHVTLSETDTIWLLDLPGTYVLPDTPETTTIRESNAIYKELLASKSTNNNFVDRPAQTFNNGMKTKDIQAVLVQQADNGCNTNEWGIYDAQQEMAANMNEDMHLGNLNSGGKLTASNTDLGAAGSGTASSMTIAVPSSRPNIDTAATGGVGSDTIESQDIIADSVSLLSGVIPAQVSGEMSNTSIGTASAMSISPGAVSNSSSMMAGFPGGIRGQQTTMENLALGTITVVNDTLLGQLDQNRLHESLQIMEAALLGNTYLTRFLDYRDLYEQHKLLFSQPALVVPNVDANGKQQSEADAFENYVPSLQFLWSFRCEIVRDRPVSYMCWNKVNSDLLAVAYGSQRENNGAPGLVCCWSLKNPEHPDRVYLSHTGHVTAVDFSKNNPSLLAVGYSDGRIAIFDVRKNIDSPILDSSSLAGKHRDTVWELKWVEREQSIGDESSRGETLVSISTDGRVCQWKIRKGLEVLDIMSLKTTMKQERDGKHKADTKDSNFISRIAGGLCFDFCKQDGSIYLAATEDGVIHRCSVSYNEQYLSSYFGHQGPVYRVKWSPFLQGTFLSCGADWTAQMWHQDRDHSLLRFNSGKDTVMDIAWDPHCATIFGSVSLDGRIEIWDLKHSVLDPAIMHSVLDQKLTAILFGETSPTVLTGDDSGNVNVYKLRRLDMMRNKTASEQSRLLQKILMGRSLAEDDAPTVVGEDSTTVGSDSRLGRSSGGNTGMNRAGSNSITPINNAASLNSSMMREDRSRPVTRDALLR